MASHSSIIIEYFDELPEIDKIEIIKDVINRYEKTIRPNQVCETIGEIEVVATKDTDDVLIVSGVEYPSIGAIFKHYDLKAANAYQKLRRLQRKNPDKGRAELLQEMVDSRADVKDDVKKKNPPLLRSHNGKISVG